MLMVLLQTLAQVLLLACGIAALAVARERDAFSKVQWALWLLTGIAFTLMGVNAVLHAAAAAGAFFAGADTAIYDLYLRWSPTGNHSRSALVIAFGVVVIWLTGSRGPLPSWFWLFAVGLLLLFLLVGGWIGWREGLLTPSRHYSAFAGLNTIGLLVLLWALWRSLLAETMDLHLWLAIAVYAIHQALNVIWLSALAWSFVPGAWSPSPWMIMLYTVIAHTTMLAVALRRLVLARRGVRAVSALDFLAPARFSSLG